MGGVLTEVFRDTAVDLPPLNLLLARRLMERTRIYRILQGYRNIPPANLEALAEILVRLSQLVTDFPEIVELDINPLLINNGKPICVDARIVMEPAKCRPPGTSSLPLTPTSTRPPGCWGMARRYCSAP